MMNDLTLYGIAAVPIIIGIVQAARYAGLSVHFAPILDIVLGVAFGVLAQYAPPYTHPVIVQGIVIGLGAGLSAAGLYASVSHFVSNPPSNTVPVLTLPAVSLSTSPAVPAPVEPPPPKVKGKAVPGSTNAVITAPAMQTE